MNSFRLTLSCWLLGLSSLGMAQENPLSPFFYIPNGDAQTEALPLLSTTAEVNIVGYIADVRITQRYKNTGEKPIEAIYVFPGSTQSAVYDMQMRLGERVIKAVIQEKTKARKTYEKAKKEGRSASLLTQHRPNVFQMNVANILPGDTIEVELAYTEVLRSEAGLYSFVYPTVVGPRYGGELLATTQSTSWIENPYLLEGQPPAYLFDLKIQINAGIPIQKLSCPSHSIHTQFQGKSQVGIQLDAKEKTGGDRDFILEYQLAGEQIQDGLLMWEGEEENFFLSMIQPPKAPQQKDLVPREYIFLLDVSGSMAGHPLDLAKGVLIDLFKTLSAKDYFNIVFFEGGSQLLSEVSVPATPANLELAKKIIAGRKGGGRTEMLSAIQQAMTIPKMEGTSRSFAIVTDGYISVEEEVFSYIQQNLGKANFFALGIGSSVNRHLLEGIAHMAMSESFIASRHEDSEHIAKKFGQYIQSPVLTDIKVDFEGLETYDVIPKQIPDLLGERPIMVFGKYRGKAKGCIKITGQQAQQNYQRAININSDAVQASNSALPFLWARHKIKGLADFGHTFGEDEAHTQAITKLGLDYNLLTQYTSFVAVDTTIRRKSGSVKSVKQPLPLPKGVPNTAIGSPQLSSAEANEVEEDEPMFFDLSTELDFAPPRSAPPPPPPPPFPTEEELFRVVEEMPYLSSCASSSKADRQSCSGKAILSFFHQHLKLPALFKTSCIEGTSVVQFIIGKDGKVKSVKVVRSIHPALDKELIRVTKLLPAFIPGRQNGRAVNVQYNIPIKIRLD